MLRVLSIAITTLLLVGAVLVGTAVVQEKRAREFSEEIAQEIYETWDYEVVRSNAIEKMRDNEEMAVQGPTMFKWGGESLGTLERLGSPKGGAGIRWGARSPLRGFYAEYSFDARFSAGAVLLDIELMFEGGQWRLAGTRFNSPVLAAKMSSAGAPTL